MMVSETGVLILIFVVLSLLFGALIKSLAKFFESPYSVILLVVGLAIGLFSRTDVVQSSYPQLNQSLITSICD
ncbi:hypothetical protein P4S72_18995 [Vibrio sp. PP-XX7]